MHRADHKSQYRLLHRDLDLLAFTGPLPSPERGHDAERHAHAGGFVADAEGFGARAAAVAPGCHGPSGHAHGLTRVRAIRRVGAGLAVTPGTGVDEPRI